MGAGSDGHVTAVAAALPGGDPLAGDDTYGGVHSVEIVPAAGYRSRVEDPDGDSITVQFTGVGEDCEITIGDHDGADHAERSEPDESSVD